MRLMNALVLALALTCLAVGCGESQTMDTEEAEKKAFNEQEGLHWPSLRRLDELTHRVTAASESAPKEELVEMTLEWMETARTVARTAPPKGVANREQVEVLQEDLSSLAKLSESITVLPEESLRKMTGGYGRVMEELMTAAGMPHIHDHDGDAKAVSGADEERAGDRKAGDDESAGDPVDEHAGHDHD